MNPPTQRSTIETLAILFAISLTYTGAAAESPRILWSVDWGADGKLFAASGEKALWIYDADSFARRRTSPINVAANSVSWHPTRQLLAVAAQANDTTGIFDSDLSLIAALKTTEGARDIAWNHDGSLLATAGNDGSTQIWKPDGTLLHTAKPQNAKSLTGVAWHPKENKVVSVGEFISVLDDRGRLLSQVRHRPKSKGMCLLLCVAWHPSGDCFAVGDYGNTGTKDQPVIQFWSPSPKLLKTIPLGSSAEVRRLSWNADGTQLVSTSDSLRIWTKDGKLSNSGRSPDFLWGVTWNDIGNKLLTTSINGRVTLWDSDAKVLKSIMDVEQAE